MSAASPQRPDTGGLAPPMLNASLLTEDVMRDIEASLAPQSPQRSADRNAMRYNVEDMRKLRDEAKERQEAIDEGMRDELLEKAAAENEEVDEEQIQAAIAIQRIARRRSAAHIVQEKHKKQETKEEKRTKKTSQVAEEDLVASVGHGMAEESAIAVEEDMQEEKTPADTDMVVDGEGPLEEETEEMLGRQACAATAIQARLRGKQARREVEEMKQIRRDEAEAAVKVQSILRGRSGRKAARMRKEETQAAVLIQKRHRKKMLGQVEDTFVKRYPFFVSDRPADCSSGMLKIKDLHMSEFEETRLDCRYDVIGMQGAVWLGAALKENSSLTELNLRGNYICDSGAKLVAMSISKNKKLKSLDLAWNSIGDDGVMQICLALAKKTSLKILDLSYNRIADLGAEGLALSIDTNPVLESLDMEGNLLSWHAASWLSAACKKGHTKVRGLKMHDKEKSKQRFGRKYDKVVDSFFESALPVFLKEALWPTFRKRWGILATQPLPKSAKQKEAEKAKEEQAMVARTDTGLAQPQASGIDQALRPGSRGNRRSSMKSMPDLNHLPGHIPGSQHLNRAPESSSQSGNKLNRQASGLERPATSASTVSTSASTVSLPDISERPGTSASTVSLPDISERPGRRRKSSADHGPSSPSALPADQETSSSIFSDASKAGRWTPTSSRPTSPS